MFSNADFLTFCFMYIAVRHLSTIVRAHIIVLCAKILILAILFVEKIFTMYYMLCLLFKQDSLTFVLLTQGHYQHLLLTVIKRGFEAIEICRLPPPLIFEFLNMLLTANLSFFRGGKAKAVLLSLLVSLPPSF